MDPRTNGPVGMADPAAAAGVAVSTVSRALSGAPGVSDTKRAEIIALARSTGYLAPESGQRTARARITAVDRKPTGGPSGPSWRGYTRC